MRIASFSTFRKHKHARIRQYGTGSSIAIIGFAIKFWPYLTRTQLLNYAIKTVLRYIKKIFLIKPLIIGQYGSDIKCDST